MDYTPTIPRDAQRDKDIEALKLAAVLETALHKLSEAVIAYGRTDVDDSAEVEWDAVLAADKQARAALAKAVWARAAIAKATGESECTRTPQQEEELAIMRSRVEL